jgi:hypothetical protein
MLCSDLCHDTSIQSLTLTEYHTLVEQLQHSHLTSADLLAHDWEQLCLQAKIDTAMIERIEQLFQRAGNIGLEISVMESLGIQILPYTDERYPAYIKNTLSTDSPPVLYYCGNLGLLDRAGQPEMYQHHVVEHDIVPAPYAPNAPAPHILVTVHGLQQVVRIKKYRMAILQNQLLCLSLTAPDRPANTALYPKVEVVVTVLQQDSTVHGNYGIESVAHNDIAFAPTTSDPTSRQLTLDESDAPPVIHQTTSIKHKKHTGTRKTTARRKKKINDTKNQKKLDL